MTVADSSLFILVLGVMLIFLLAGRMLVSHTHSRDFYYTPLSSFSVGAGVWYIWFLVLVAFVGISLKLAWWLYLLSFVALLTVLTKAFATRKGVEHFWTKFIFSLILAAPALVWSLTDVPTQLSEFANYTKSANFMFWQDGLPDIGAAVEYGVFANHDPKAFAAVTLPTSILAKQFVLSGYALFNLLLVMLVHNQNLHFHQKRNKLL